MSVQCRRWYCAQVWDIAAKNKLKAAMALNLAMSAGKVLHVCGAKGAWLGIALPGIAVNRLLLVQIYKSGTG